jgi:predicted enzyme related to lactoylglutathione lyase
VAILINIDVPDLEQAITFYTQGLGLRVGRRMGPEFVELLGADAPIYLLVKKADTTPFEGAPQKRTYARHWSPVHLDFVVEDIDMAVTRAKSAGATQESAVSDHAYGKLALFADPFGHGFCLLQFNARGYDAIATS